MGFFKNDDDDNDDDDDGTRRKVIHVTISVRDGGWRCVCVGGGVGGVELPKAGAIQAKNKMVFGHYKLVKFVCFAVFLISLLVKMCSWL